MSEASRQRRLNVQNRLEELNAKYGPVDDEMPDWLDHLPDKPSRPVPAVAHAAPLPVVQTSSGAGLLPAAALTPPVPRPISEDLPV